MYPTGKYISDGKIQTEKLLTSPGDTLYALAFHLLYDETIQVGKKGTFSFERGTYIYIGSAKKNMEARLNRHLSVDKKLRWHIDYIREKMHFIEGQTYLERRGECQLVEATATYVQATRPISQFGASDCKCKGHLLFVPYFSTGEGWLLPREKWKRM
ncbi:GIY-YIG nuclease family protein [Texcoconibacillus texcoconensis]|uniref:Uri superfamily endonuclease n=1 Tax=Texcoconibacillus texcoconensis TaxID=1095777 RepID=A0A840QSL0_9BACI|nr:GIY-YIG nuclease family protein [Texcoconibacillus texcoconensis]MBB5174355.1 Uri superfamily endonuclease [Texcoconibacillus texcoconensis]